MKINIEKELSRKIHIRIGEKYKYIVNEQGFIQAIPMTKEEENERYREEMQALLDANTKNGVLDGEAFEKDVHDLNVYYGNVSR